MKKLLFLIFVLFGTKLFSQIVFEQKYDSAATYNFCSGNQSQLTMVNLELSGENYLKINRKDHFTE
jgi:hypothetical protein